VDAQTFATGSVAYQYSNGGVCMSSDYSNLFRGGGITSGRAGGGKSNGPKILAYFVFLCVLAVGVVWVSGYFDDDVKVPHAGDSNSSSANSSQPIGAPNQSSESSNDALSPKQIITTPGVSPEKVGKLSKKIEMAKDLLKKEDYVNAVDAASSILASVVDANTTIGAQAEKILGDANAKIFM